jgi:hypothetical protein
VALGQIKGESAVKSLISVLKDKDEDFNVRTEAAEALGHIKGESAVKSLISVLKDKDENFNFRANVAETLKDIGDNASIMAVQQYEETKAVQQYEEKIAKKEKRISKGEKGALCFAFAMGTIPSSEKEFIDTLIVKFALDIEPLHYWVEKVQTLPTPREIASNILLKTGEKGYRANLEKVEVCDFNIAVYGIKGKFAIMYF